jgi:hypothetical protein
MRAKLLGVLIGLALSPATLLAARAAVNHSNPVEFHLLAPSGLQDLQPAMLDMSTEEPELEALAHTDGLTLASFPNATAKPVDPLNDPDDFIHDGPRSRMKKWFLGILVVGALVRYLSSDSYRRFVSEVLDPLNW